LPTPYNGVHSGGKENLTVRTQDKLNRLTRHEWNAAYFLGMEALFTENKGASFAHNIAIGVKKMADSGYDFKSLHIANKLKSSTVSCDLAPSEHGLACREIADGSFDMITRAREALEWLSLECPDLDTSWLESLLSVYDGAHDTKRSKLGSSRAKTRFISTDERFTASRTGQKESERETASWEDKKLPHTRFSN